MIQGRFGNTSGRPYFEGRLSFPDLGLTGDISFIFDTGADTSVLMPVDAQRLGLDHATLTEAGYCYGIGGACKQFIEPAMLAFTDPKTCVHVYFLNMRIAEPTPEIEEFPSLLGRDVIDHWSTTYNKHNAGLTAEVIHSDMEFPLDAVS